MKREASENNVLRKIAVKVIEPKTPFKDKFAISISGLEKHTYDFISAEAAARNMGNSEFMRNVCEVLESGDF